MRKTSIITLICTFFALTLVVINIAFVIEYKRQVQDSEFFTLQRFRMALDMLLHRDDSGEEALKSYGVHVSTLEKAFLEEHGDVVLDDKFGALIRYDNKLYFFHKKPPRKPFERDFMMGPPPPPPPNSNGFEPPPEFKHTFDMLPVLENSEPIVLHRFWVLVAVVNTLLMLFFTAVLRKLLRLNHLKNAIRLFGEQKEFEGIEEKGDDELSEIAHEFNVAMEKIHLLKEARTLFLRNILHELKTPIMKGKLLANTIENSQKQERFEVIFNRLETLLGEMVKIEKLSSNEWRLEPKEYRLVDVLDHSKDLLIHGAIERIVDVHHEEAPLILVDYELFATAIKNLLDNALKYSEESIEVDMYATSLSIRSCGEKLTAEQMNFSRPFNRPVESSNTGLGLGLYIANAIIEKHGFSLGYAHSDGKNVFTVYFL